MKSLKTPYFILDEQELKNEVCSLQKAIKDNWYNSIIAYSVKTNSLPYLVNFFKKQNVYAEVVSENEYDMVTLCGMPYNRIICNGPVKNKKFIYRLLQNNIIVNIDSHSEIASVVDYALQHSCENVEVCIRVNIDIEGSFPSESNAGLQGSRFGFCDDNNELKDCISKLNKIPNLQIAGLHLHVSTSTRRVEVFRWLTLKFSQIVKKYKLNKIRYFDIGGGFFGGLIDKPGWNDYLKGISEMLVNEGFRPESLTVILEPGVSLLAGAFSYYMSVVDVKDTNRSRFVVMDGSRIHIDPFFHKEKYAYNIINERQLVHRVIVATQRLVGFTCLEYDNIMVLHQGPELKEGDVIRCDKLGAYTISLSPLFISYFPPVYSKNCEGNIITIRKKWTAKEFVQNSLIK